MFSFSYLFSEIIVVLKFFKLNRFGNTPQVHIPEVEHPVAYQRGTNRFRYFQRPIIPFLQQVPPDVIFQQPTLVCIFWYNKYKLFLKFFLYYKLNSCLLFVHF